MGVVASPDAVEVIAQRFEKQFIVGQERHPVAVRLGVVDGEGHVLEVQVLDAKEQGFEIVAWNKIESLCKEIG